MSIFLNTHHHVIILDDEILGQLIPSGNHFVTLGAAIGSKIVDRCLLVGLAQFNGSSLDLRLQVAVALVERVAHGLEAGHHQAVARIHHVGHPVAHPVGIVATECHTVGPRRVVALGLPRTAAVDGRIGAGVAVIVGPPHEPTHLAWQPRTHLRYPREGALLRCDGTLVEVLHSIHFII